MKNKIIVAVQKIDFDLNLEMESLKAKTKKAGAAVFFVGKVRDLEDDKLQSECLKEIYEKNFFMYKNYNIDFVNFSNDSMVNTASKLVHFGWKNEAIPISRSKKSIIVRFFEAIFG